ncbi:sex-regulated protein janus-A-like [Schistocerca piceifrons]|uniref:sex-regulated protein janus-A-like n=1 Tax=Schistocerca piceifrons TaxID=274613 RepID=UPI001F5F8D45|nr:sex-regulated protein janus-A-like [Schistocerca piceifrons]
MFWSISNIQYWTLMTAAEKLAAVHDVDIDPEGTFKYVLIRVFGPEGPDGKEPSKLVGFGKADHSKTVEILKTAYPVYNITWSDEGY